MVLFLAVVFTGAALPGPEVRADAPPGGDPAWKAAQARQAAVKTLEVEFRVTAVIARGGISQLRPGAPKTAIIVPAKEATVSAVDRLLIDGEMYRTEFHALLRHPVSDVFTPIKEISTFNGSVATRFFPHGLSKDGKPSGTIRPATEHSAFRTYDAIPVALTYRGLQRSFTPHLVTDLKPTGATRLLGDSVCNEYVMNLITGAPLTCWLDPNRDYHIVRMETQTPGKASEELAIHYRQLEGFGWAPASWVRRQLSPSGVLWRSWKVDVLKFRVNEPQPPEQFGVPFPEGMIVQDVRDRSRYQVMPGGSLRKVSLTDLEEAEQPAAAGHGQNRWLVINLVILAVGLSLLYLIRRHRINHAD
jgi:hypothetical protein